MDWGRAKTILIVILLVLNAALAGTIASRAIGGADDERIYRDVGQIFESRGLSVLCELPRNVRASSMLVYEDGAERALQAAQSFADHAGVAVVALAEGGGAASDAGGANGGGGGGPSGGAAGRRVELVGRESFRYTCDDPAESLPMDGGDERLGEALRGALGDMGMDMSQFRLDSVEWLGAAPHEGAVASFVQTYKGSLVFDSIVSARVTQRGGIAEVAVRLRGIRGLSPRSAMKVAPAYQVILRHYTKTGQTIRSIDIGFIGQSAAADDDYKESEEGAVWRVRLDDGTERYFDAAYGDEIYLDDL